jgi:hypothetical protein
MRALLRLTVGDKLVTYRALVEQLLHTAELVHYCDLEKGNRKNCYLSTFFIASRDEFCIHDKNLE